MPLKIADPENELGDGGGAGIDFDAEELVRVHGMRFAEFEFETFAEGGGDIEDFAFQPFEMFECDVEEIAGTASRVEDFDLAKMIVESVYFGARFLEVASAGVSDGGRADTFPFGAERFDD